MKKLYDVNIIGQYFQIRNHPLSIIQEHMALTSTLILVLTQSQAPIL